MPGGICQLNFGFALLVYYFRASGSFAALPFIPRMHVAYISFLHSSNPIAIAHTGDWYFYFCPLINLPATMGLVHDSEIVCSARHNCFGPPSLLVEGLLSTGLPRLVLPLGRDGVTITSFSSIPVVKTRPAHYQKTTH